MIIRAITPADYQTTRALIRRVFDESHAELVEALRGAGDAAIELAAIADGNAIGHILCSALQSPPRSLALAPLGVDAAHRRKGVGGALIEAAIERALFGNWLAIFVLGRVSYYARFGFDAAKAAPFETPYPKAHFMVRELARGALAGLPRQVVYAPAFADIGV